MRIYALLPEILNMSLTAGIVTILVLLVRIPLRKAPRIFSYALWAVVLFRLVCPISFSSEFSLLGVFRAPAAANGGIAYIPSEFVSTGAPQADLSSSDIGKAINSNLPQGGEQTAAAPAKPRMAAAAMLWLAGIAAMLVYSAVSLLLLRRRLVGAVRLRENIYLADRIATPFAIGVIRPKIFLPSSLAEQEQGYIILHEQTHIRRQDHIVKMIFFLALAVHWFNPLVWAAFVCCIKDMEMSCDERVIKEMGGEIKGAYSTSLLSLSAGRRLVNGSPLAFGEGNLKGRIRNVMSFKKPRFWVLITAATVVIIAAMFLLANPPKAGTPETPVSASSVTGYSLAPAYAFDKCLYMNPLSSYNPQGDTGQLYLFDSEGAFTIASEETGEIQVIYSLSDWNGKEVDTKEWNALFDFGDPVDISSYSVRRQYEVADKYRIYQMDDEVWLAAINKGSLWSLYRLKETTKPDFAGGTGLSAAESELAASGLEPASLELQPASPAISLEQEVGVDMAELDYASDNIVIFHGYFGLFVYHLDSKKIVRSLDLKPIGCNATQGDNYCEVTVSTDGNTVQLHSMSSKDMYVYTVSDNTLQKTAYKRMENRFADFVDITEIIDLQVAGSCSHSAVKFDTGEYGYLRTSDWTVGTLTYVRGGDMLYRLFDPAESGVLSSKEAAEPSAESEPSAAAEPSAESEPSAVAEPSAAAPPSTAVGFETGEGNNVKFFVTTYPAKYSPAMSSTPGFRLDITYNGPAAQIRYEAETGGFITWKNYVVEDLGNKTTRPADASALYWRPDYTDPKDDVITLTVLNETGEKIAGGALTISKDAGGGFFTVSTQTAKPSPATEPAAAAEPPAKAAKPWELVSWAFAEAFFNENTNAMKSYLMDPDKDFYEYNLDKGLDDARAMKLKYSPDDIRSDSASVEFVFRFEGEDSYSYLSLSLKKIDDVWKVEFYGLEK